MTPSGARLQDAFEQIIARTQPSALCPLGDTHFIIMAGYLQSLMLAPMPREHVAGVENLPWLLQRARAGADPRHGSVALQGLKSV